MGSKLTMDYNPTFEIGQKVIFTSDRIYQFSLTVGREYTVVDFIPKIRQENGFVFEECVTVIGDLGKRVTAHAYRFKAQSLALKIPTA